MGHSQSATRFAHLRLLYRARKPCIQSQQCLWRSLSPAAVTHKHVLPDTHITPHSCRWQTGSKIQAMPKTHPRLVFWHGCVSTFPDYSVGIKSIHYSASFLAKFNSSQQRKKNRKRGKCIFCKKNKNNEMFITSSRADEVSRSWSKLWNWCSIFSVFLYKI